QSLFSRSEDRTLHFAISEWLDSVLCKEQSVYLLANRTRVVCKLRGERQTVLEGRSVLLGKRQRSRLQISKSTKNLRNNDLCVSRALSNIVYLLVEQSHLFLLGSLLWKLLLDHPLDMKHRRSRRLHLSLHKLSLHVKVASECLEVILKMDLSKMRKHSNRPLQFRRNLSLLELIRSQGTN